MQSLFNNGFASFALIFTVNLFTATFTSASEFPDKQRVFYGGGIGATFGDVQYFEISPMVGVNINPRTAVGLSFLYRYRKDTRYKEDLSTNDYGATLFGRFHLTPNLYLQAEYEYLTYEYYRYNIFTNTSIKESDDFSSFLAGGGFSAPIGGRASMFVTALYNFSYDDPNSPYSEPIQLRFGVGVGF